MGLLGEHAERPRVHAAPSLGEELEGVVGLARVRRAEMRDDRLRRRAPLGEPDRDAVLGTPDRGALVCARRTGVARRPRRSARRTWAWSTASGHRATVAAALRGPGRGLRPSDSGGA